MTGNSAGRGSVFYDAQCRLCVAGRQRWGALFERRGFSWVPLQTPGTAARLRITENQLRSEMWLQRADGRTLVGVDAWCALMRSVWWLSPLGMLMALPGIHAAARILYRWIARNRHCLGGSCNVHSHTLVGVHLGDAHPRAGGRGSGRMTFSARRLRRWLGNDKSQPAKSEAEVTPVARASRANKPHRHSAFLELP